MWEQPYKLFSVQLQWKCWVRRGRGGEECVLSRCPTSNLSPLRRWLTGTIHLVKLKREELEIRSPVIFAPTLIIRPFTCLPLETSWSLALVWRNPNQFLSPFTCLLETDRCTYGTNSTRDLQQLSNVQCPWSDKSSFWLLKYNIDPSPTNWWQWWSVFNTSWYNYVAAKNWRTILVKINLNPKYVQ